MSNTINTPWLVKSYSADTNKTLQDLKDAIAGKGDITESFNLVAGNGITLISAVDESNVSSLYVNNSLLSGSVVVIGDENEIDLEHDNDGLIVGNSNKIDYNDDTDNGYFTVLGEHNELKDDNFVIANGYSNKLSGFKNSMLNGNANTANNVQFTIANGQANTLLNLGYSLVAGNGNTLSGINEMDGNYNIVFGDSNTVENGNFDYVYGQSNRAVGTLNDILGANNKVSGVLNFVVGSGHRASGSMNMILGLNNSAVNDNEGSILMGNNLIATAPYQIIMGATNDPDDVIKSVYNSNSDCYSDNRTTITKEDGVNYVYPMFVLAGDSYPKEGSNRNSHTIYKDGQIMLRFDNPDYAVDGKYPMTEVLINSEYFAKASATSKWVDDNKSVTDDVALLKNTVAECSELKANKDNYDNIVDKYSAHSADYYNIVSAVSAYSSYFAGVALNEDSNMNFEYKVDEDGLRKLYLSANGGGGSTVKNFVFTGDATINVSGPEWDEEKQYNLYTLSIPEPAQTQVTAKKDGYVSVTKNDNGVVEIGLDDAYVTDVNNKLATIDTKLDTSVYSTWSAGVEASAAELNAGVNSLMDDRYKASALYKVKENGVLDEEPYIKYDRHGTCIFDTPTQIHNVFTVWSESYANKFELNESQNYNSARKWRNSDDWSTMIKPKYTGSNSIIKADDIETGLQIQVIEKPDDGVIPTATSMFTWVVEPVEG